ncbi:methyltransferase domain-containing protein [Cohnella sp. CFH 77786]|uniref:class I SAM-dependent methyltransferase n=1 Tax=Cohnella sp. CFH 77786 TaxID=2662265 RepID=UPI001C61106D|nr:class I SAM-dependent methyltransferase [Cohnella sp. CFH 77786]MBW5448546.1 methyltransferase domain-containing protein [Cohnella sp. CFH 77786]
MEYMDLLSKLGVASAHPGGFRATKRLLEKGLQSAGLHVLEVGCGTGKSACYLAQQGFRVTALDQHPLMLHKAKQRAEKEGIGGIEWVLGSVHDLPFGDAAFDVVFAESVTLFAGLEPSLREYYRVLKPGGRLLDREMVLHEELPETIYEEIKSYFRIDKIHTVDEWLECLHRTGFRCERPELDAFVSHEQSVEQNDIKEMDISLLWDPEVGEGILKYSELMLAQQPYFRACDFMATKEQWAH